MTDGTYKEASEECKFAILNFRSFHNVDFICNWIFFTWFPGHVGDREIFACSVRGSFLQAIYALMARGRGGTCTQRDELISETFPRGTATYY